jgi:phage shock protein PspC (stress-responsive transcriptional regulator)
MKSLPAKRPAEFTAFAAAVALLIAKAFGLDDPDTITAIAVVIGFIPSVVTGIVEYVRKT